MQVRIDKLLIGTIDPDFAPFREGGSAIAKISVDVPLSLGWLGLWGDEQADLRFHGGADKAVHHYPRDHYRLWRCEVGELPRLGQAGAFGENVSTTGWTEDDVCLGDRFRVGTAIVEVSQGRQPCWKQAHFLGVPDLAALMVQTGRTGWYYRVIEEGRVAAGDMVTLIDRPLARWPIVRLFSLLVGGLHRGNRTALLELAETPVLAREWRDRAARLAG